MNPLASVIQLYAHPRYSPALSKASATFGTTLDELLRHHPSLKTIGILAVIKMLEDLTSLKYIDDSVKMEQSQYEDLIIEMIGNSAKVRKSSII